MAIELSEERIQELREEEILESIVEVLKKQEENARKLSSLSSKATSTLKEIQNNSDKGFNKIVEVQNNLNQVLNGLVMNLQAMRKKSDPSIAPVLDNMVKTVTENQKTVAKAMQNLTSELSKQRQTEWEFDIRRDSTGRILKVQARQI